MVSGTEATVKITHGSPARAAYAAVDAPWLPVDEIVITRAPVATAWVTASEQRRSLYDQVGFWLSSFAYRRGSPIRRPSRSRCTSAVAPSPSEIGSASGRGSSRRKRQRLRGVAGKLSGVTGPCAAAGSLTVRLTLTDSRAHRGHPVKSR
jgi:hypothetical protein